MTRIAHAGWLIGLALTVSCAGDDGADTDTDADTEVALCPDGTEPRAFVAETEGFEFGQTAGDFTVNQIEAPDWTLSEHFTGCDSYLFLVDWESSRSSSEMFDSPVFQLFQDEPGNVHFFFVSDRTTSTLREEVLLPLRDEVEASLETMPSAEAEDLRGRIHYVWDRARNIEGSVGEFLTDYLSYAASPGNRVDLGDRGQAPPPPLAAWGINRAQQWDPGGSMSQAVGAPASFRMPRYLPHFYNYMERLDQELAATDATEVVLVDEDNTDRIMTKSVTLPGATEMAAFDTMELDVELTCPHRNPFACSEWDRIATIDWCVDEECSERWQIGKWITQYWRRGRRHWVIDATPFLPLVQDGGTQTFRIQTGPQWERATLRNVRVSVRLRTQGDRPKPIAVEKLFGGGNFNAEYNDREPITVTPAAGASRVDLVYILSGHGQTQGNNCAEWCDHRHTFSLDGTDLETIRSDMAIATQDGCADRADEGVPPGQWGNWPQSRAYWCPGLPVPAKAIDVTAQVSPGTPVEVGYRGSFGTGEPRGGNISMQTYLVSYE